MLTKKAQRAIEGEQGANGDAPAQDQAPATTLSDAPAEALPEDQLRERLNIFEGGGSPLDQLNNQ